MYILCSHGQKPNSSVPIPLAMNKKLSEQLTIVIQYFPLEQRLRCSAIIQSPIYPKPHLSTYSYPWYIDG